MQSHFGPNPGAYCTFGSKYDAVVLAACSANVAGLGGATCAEKERIALRDYASPML